MWWCDSGGAEHVRRWDGGGRRHGEGMEGQIGCKAFKDPPSQALGWGESGVEWGEGVGAWVRRRVGLGG